MVSGFTRPSAGEIALMAIRHYAIQEHDELTAVCELLLERQPRVVLELGTARGGTFMAWCMCAAEDALLVGVDWRNPNHHAFLSEQELVGNAQWDQTVIPITGDIGESDTYARICEALDGRPVDFLFIDADHRESAVRRDHALYAPLVRPGGLVAFHDIREVEPHPNPAYRIEVAPVWREVREGKRAWEFLHDDGRSGGRWGGIGVYER